MDGPKDEEKGIPMCTLRNFPSQIEHCIEWARAEFFGSYSQPFTQALKVVKDPIEFVDGVRSGLAAVTKRGEKVRVRLCVCPGILQSGAVCPGLCKH